MSDPILRIDGLEKHFGGIRAVDGLDMSVERGSVVGLIGPNGAGKSTTFNLVTGFLEPTAGTVYFEGEDVTGEKPYDLAKRGVGRTFQETKPFGNLSVFENLLVASTPESGQAKVDRANEVLDRLELQRVKEQNGDELSGGQKKLLELARVLMLDPDVIMLDEPSAGVNPALMDDILDHIRRLNEEGRTILVIEHDMSIIAELCDTVVVMSNGEEIAEGTFEEIRQNERVRSAYLGT